MLSAQRGCSGRALIVCLFLLLFAAAAVAQEAPAPKVEIYGGYLWYDPSARVNGTQFRSMDKGIQIQSTFYAHHNYTGGADGSRDWNSGARIGGGIVLKLGSFGGPAAPPSASCSAQPGEVMAGEPVTVTANAQNFPPNRTLTYNWTSTGGKTSGNQQSTQVDTAGLAPGSYTVTANISSGKKNETASCKANFSVKEQPKNPPTISCTANPTTVNPGENSTITCTATSPDNRPVTVAFQSSAGKLTPSGNTATLDTTGAQPGAITVTATATDDRGLTGSTTATVTVNQPPPPPPPPPTASK